MCDAVICQFVLKFILVHTARGTCVATVEYDAESPDELSLAPGDHIIIVGLLVSCFDWFTGKKEATGEVGLVKASLVKPSSDISKWVAHQWYCYCFQQNTQSFILWYNSLLCYCHLSSSEDIFLQLEDRFFFGVQEDRVMDETIALLKKKCQNDTGHNYKLGKRERLQKASQGTYEYVLTMTDR